MYGTNSGAVLHKNVQRIGRRVEEGREKYFHCVDLDALDYRMMDKIQS
jgi:hypothetical protein